MFRSIGTVGIPSWVVLATIRTARGVVVPVLVAALLTLPAHSGLPFGHVSVVLKAVLVVARGSYAPRSSVQGTPRPVDKMRDRRTDNSSPLTFSCSTPRRLDCSHARMTDMIV